jgi:hypothetical protein
MISFGQLESRIRTLYEAESHVRISTEDILVAANEGLDELSEATKFYERFAPVPLKGGQTYYDMRGFLPNSVIGVNSVYNLTQQMWLKPRKFRDFGGHRWHTVIGDPQKYLIRGLFWLGVYPRPGSDTGNLRVYYSSLAPHFKDSASVLSDLPDDFVAALEDYALYCLSADDAETDKALIHWDSYLTREAALKKFVKERIVTARIGRMGRR